MSGGTSGHTQYAGPALLFSLALAKLLVQFAAINQYGYFVDELYFMAASERLDWGYVDMAPMAPLVIASARLLMGDSLLAVRFFSAIAGAVLVLLTMLMARELGWGEARREQEIDEFKALPHWRPPNTGDR